MRMLYICTVSLLTAVYLKQTWVELEKSRTRVV